MPSEQLLIVKIVSKWRALKKVRWKRAKKKSDVVCLFGFTCDWRVREKFAPWKSGANSFFFFLVVFRGRHATT